MYTHTLHTYICTYKYKYIYIYIYILIYESITSIYQQYLVLPCQIYITPTYLTYFISQLNIYLFNFTGHLLVG